MARGMTLIEVMIAMIIVTVGLMGALAMSSALFAGGNFSRSATEASQLAQAKLEETILVQLTAPTLPATTTETTLDGTGKVVAGGPYTRVTNWAYTTNHYTTTVTVTWSDYSNASKTHTVTQSRDRVSP